MEHIIALARTSGHRIYTIGVGSAPAESLLKELAKDTGGACEFVTPNEDMRDAIDRMLERMRTAQEVRFAIQWNATDEKHKEHEWASTLPPQLIDGETIHLYARLPAKTEKPPMLVCKTFSNNEEQEVSSAKPAHMTWDTEGIVARLCAAAQIAELSEDKIDAKLAKSMAMKYQLVTQHTNLFLLHERAEDSKAEGLPKLQQMAQMQAAGWSGHGTVDNSGTIYLACRMGASMDEFDASDIQESRRLGGDYGRLNTPSVWRTNRTQVAAKVDGMASAGMDDIEIPAFLRKQADGPDLNIPALMTPAPKANLQDWITTFNSVALHNTTFRQALQQTLKLWLPSEYTQVIIDLTQHTKDSAISWALLFEWLLGESGQEKLLDKHAQRLLRSQLKLATEAMYENAKDIFERTLSIVN